MNAFLPKSRRRRVAYMHAFFDESEGFYKQGFICLAGFVSDSDGRDGFSRDWGALLTKHQIEDIGLHTKDFMAARKGYEKFKDIDRTKILLEFVYVIRKHVLLGIAIGVDGKAYTELMGPYEKAINKRKPNPKSFCFARIVRRLNEAVLKIDKEPLMLIFDDNDETSMTFYQLLRGLQRERPEELRKRIVGIAFCDDKLVMPLQAADVIAWISTKEIVRGNDAFKDSPYREILLTPDPALGIQYESENWDRKDIQEKILGEYAKVYPDVAEP